VGVGASNPQWLPVSRTPSQNQAAPFPAGPCPTQPHRAEPHRTVPRPSERRGVAPRTLL